MTREQVLNSRDALKRFCRDYNVPVSTFDSNHFYNQLNTLSLYSDHYIKLFDEFVQELEPYPSIESYFEYYNSVKEKIIDYIHSSLEFKSFSESIINTPKVIKQELYSPSNNGRDFISIDLRKANFTILEMNCPNLFNGKTWEDFMRDFGASEYLVKSKYIRQVIFGACNPKKQIQAQTKLMSDIATKLQLEDFNVYSVVTDEIILSVDPSCPTNVTEVIATLRHYFPEIIDKLKIECFNLIKNTQGYEKFVVASSDAQKWFSVFKCIDSDVFCQVIKYYYHQDIEESDLVFDYKGSLARFMNPISNPFQNDYLGG